MIYKFIDNNGSEITVNSISSLQALVDSETVKKNTKVKAGLRGKWTIAENIPELVFEEKKEDQTQEIAVETEEDIKSFITKEEPKEEVKEIPEKKPTKEAKTKEVKEPIVKSVDEDVEVKSEETQDETTTDASDYYTEQFNKNNNQQSDDNTPGVTFKDSWKICLSKITDFSGRASRSEFWKFYLSFFVLYFLILAIIFMVIVSANPYISDGALDALATILAIPAGLITLSATVRRLHDTNKSGWLILISLIPFIGLIVVIILLFEGDKGKNKYGDNPLK